MQKIPSIRLLLKAFHELGPKQLGLYVWYQFGLRSGYLLWRTSGKRQALSLKSSTSDHPNRYWLKVPPRKEIEATIGAAGIKALLSEADEIVEGRVRLFGGPPVPLQLTPSAPPKHWTVYDTDQLLNGNEDIKWIWEPGRFGWVYTLARAYHLSEKEIYSQAFWSYAETFLDANPPYLGPHWISAQEVALRLMAFSFALQIFHDSPHTSTERLNRLVKAIVSHAERIPPTLAYARAQNNNHLLIEAAGLLTASLTLPEHPKARQWKKIGWHWLNEGFQSQISPDGVYIQQSTSCHGLMLQIALWAYLLMRSKHPTNQESGRHSQQEVSERNPPITPNRFPGNTRQRLAASTQWLLELVDPDTGQAPNLGPNDSAYILPLTVCPFLDFRPVLQAAARAFLDAPAFPLGTWDEMSLWFNNVDNINRDKTDATKSPLDPLLPIPSKNTPIVLHGIDSWAYLRVANFNNRPGHADQLHLDLWWRGLNLAQDAGTYLYNGSPPWDNALARTQVHNTIIIEGQDQMNRAGRFLWLDWAQGDLLKRQHAQDNLWERVAAQHDGYLRLGVIHQREVEYQDGDWTINDTLLPSIKSKSQTTNNQPLSVYRRSPFLIRLHWLLPDWPWDIMEKPKDTKTEIRINSPHGWITLRINIYSESDASSKISGYSTQIYRAGELIHGKGSISPTLGWVSRNYGYKTPALSFSIETKSNLPLTFVTEWNFPD